MNCKALIIGSDSALAKIYTEHLKNTGIDVSGVPGGSGNDVLFDPFCLEKIIHKEGPDFVINFIGSFTNDFNVSLRVNLLISRAIMESAVKARYCGRIILLGSCAEYGHQQEYRVGIPEAPRSIYGVTKLMQKTLFNFYVNRYNLDGCYVRLFNVAATGLNTRLFIGTLTHQLVQAMAVGNGKVKLGPLDSLRDYISRGDLCRGLDTVIKKGEPGGIYNLGMGKSIKIEELVKGLIEELGAEIDIETRKVESVGGITNEVTACLDGIRRIGWEPQDSYRELIRNLASSINKLAL